MDIKDLNKSQLILLAILLSFVTSIATGITTVTLMQQAPSSVAVPINRVVQQTIEKIQQVEGKTTTQTVVVKEEDLVVDAIAKNQSAMFTITKNGLDVNNNPIEISAGHGFAVSNSDILVADALLVPDQETYYVSNKSGKFKANFISTDKGGFSFLKVGAPVDSTIKLAYTVPSFGDITKMKVGQKIILLGENIATSIFEGKDNVHLSVGRGEAGGLVLDLDGDAVGIALSGDVSFAPISAITSALKPTTTPTAPATQQ